MTTTTQTPTPVSTKPAAKTLNTVKKVATGMIRVKLTGRQMQAALKMDKTWIKTNLTPVAKGKDNAWQAMDGTPATIQTLYEMFVALSTAKTAPFKMKLHMYAVCGAAARYLGDRLTGEATVAVKASKFGQSWEGIQAKMTKHLIEVNRNLEGVGSGDINEAMKAEIRKLAALLG